jgi:hypothetical protein
MWRWLSRLPIAIGAVLLIVPWFYLTWNTTIGELIPSIRFRTKQTIAGVVQEAAPMLSVDTLLSGEYQQSISRAIGVLSPVFKPAVQLRSQLFYSLFHAAGTDHILIGRQQYLMERSYLDEYCSRNLATMRPLAEEWAEQIRAMQDFFTQRGKVFVYVITPSKVAQMPQIIPQGYKCPASPEDRSQKLAVYDEILTQHGVHVVDLASFLSQAREEYGFDMFPRGGTHWNRLAAALATQRFIAAVNAQRGAPMLIPFSFTWQVSYDPEGVDRDLLDLLNLPYADARYPVAALQYVSKPPATGCPQVRMAAVGGSFVLGILGTLSELACPVETNHWFYWSDRHLHHVGRRARELPVNAGMRRNSLLDADIVVFEENDSVAPGSRQGRPFLDLVAALAANR